MCYKDGMSLNWYNQAQMNVVIVIHGSSHRNLTNASFATFAQVVGPNGPSGPMVNIHFYSLYSDFPAIKVVCLSAIDVII